MKKFKFRYANILKLREDHEEAVKRQLKNENQKLNLLEDHKTQLDMDYRQYRSDLQEKLSSGIKGHEAKQINANQIYFRDKIDQAIWAIHRQQQVIENVKSDLTQAIQERKVMEKLKEKEFIAYQEASRKEEVKETDEVVNYQNSKRSGD